VAQIYENVSYYGEDAAWLKKDRSEQLFWDFEHADKLADWSSMLGRPTGAVLDVGCSGGLLLEYALSQGWHAEGVEPSEVAVAEAHEHGVAVHHCLYQGLDLPAASFDVIHSKLLVEHLHDPAGFFAWSARLLRANGLLTVHVPNDFNPLQLAARDELQLHDWWVAPPFHLNYFSFQSLERLLEHLDRGAQLLDTREQAEFEGAHIRRALNIGLGGQFATWCGTILDPERPVVLVAEPGREVEAATRLGRIGFDSVAGYLACGMQQLDHAPELLERTERITAGSVAEQLTAPQSPLLVDVRTTQEWSETHIASAMNLPLSQLPGRLDELPSDRQLIVYCASGYRSAIAASLLRREGFSQIANLVGGLAAWTSAQLPTLAANA